MSLSPSRIVLVADNSQVSTFLSCPKLWHYMYVKGLESSTLSKRKSVLDRGTVVHGLLDLYYKLRGLGRKPIEAQKEATELFRKIRGTLPEISQEDEELVTRRFFNYVTHYWSRDLEPLVIEGIPQVELGFSVELVNSPSHYFVLEGRLDLVGKSSSGETFFVDHKTQERTYDHFQFDTQFLTYSLACGFQKGFVNYFGLQKEMNDKTFRRLPLSFSTPILLRWRERLTTIFYRMAHARESGNLEPNEKACSYQYGNVCQYWQPCWSTGKKAEEGYLRLNFKERTPFRPWSLNELVQLEGVKL